MGGKDDRIVITGIGIISSVGNDKETFFENLINGVSGAGVIQSYDVEKYPNIKSRIACESTDFNPKDLIERKRLRQLARFSQMSTVAAFQARDDAGLNLSEIPSDRAGCIIGATADYATIEDAHTKVETKKGGRQNPFAVPKSIPNMAAANTAIDLGINGVNFAVHTACATGAHAVAMAWYLLKSGVADVIFAGGSESAITPLTVDSYGCMGVLSSRNDEPRKASRPFDKERDGFVIGEGAGILVMEKESHAKKRGADIIAVVGGAGLNTDAASVAIPDAEGKWAAEAMKGAVRSAGLSLEDIGYINAHGTSTKANDVIETKAVMSVFKDREGGFPMISSTKSMTGHCLSAAGALEAAVTAMALQRGVIPPTINLDEADEQCPLDYTANTAREVNIKAALSNSFGFGGQNGSLCLMKYE